MLELGFEFTSDYYPRDMEYVLDDKFGQYLRYDSVSNEFILMENNYSITLDIKTKEDLLKFLGNE